MHWCPTRQHAAIEQETCWSGACPAALSKTSRGNFQEGLQVTACTAGAHCEQGFRPAPPHLCCQPPLLPEALPLTCGPTIPCLHLRGQPPPLLPQLAGLPHHPQPVRRGCCLAAHAPHLRCVKSRLPAAPQGPQATRLPHCPQHLGFPADLVPCQGCLPCSPQHLCLAAHLAPHWGCLRCGAQLLRPPVHLPGLCLGCETCATSVARRCARLCAWHAA